MLAGLYVPAITNTTVKMWHEPYPHLQGSTIKRADHSENVTWTISTPPGFYDYTSTPQWKYDMNHIHTSWVLWLYRYATVKVWQEPYPHLLGSTTNANTTVKVWHEIYPQFKDWHEVYTQFKVLHDKYSCFQGYTTSISTTVKCEMNHIHTSRVLWLMQTPQWKYDMKYIHSSIHTSCDMKYTQIQGVTWNIFTPPGLYK